MSTKEIIQNLSIETLGGLPPSELLALVVLAIGIAWLAWMLLVLLLVITNK
ncbi:MAG: hypothetical protein ACTS6J_09395 [Burkholderiales bacterium]